MTGRRALGLFEPGLFDLGRLVRFGSVGMASTLLYAALAWGLTLGARIGAAPASVIAYVIAGAASYLVHKRFTFRSRAAHDREAPRFLCVSALGAGVALLAPVVLTGRLGFPPMIAIAFTCGAVPAVNYLMFDRLVFRDGSRAEPRQARRMSDG
jgi:putative flippase GtrA